MKIKKEKLKRRVEIALAILFIGILLYSAYFIFYYVKPCKDQKCFVEAMKTCKRVSFIRADPQAVWLYIILGSNKDNCEVRVRLQELRKGILDGEKLQGKEMICLVKKNSAQFPEKDISKCSGKLKEEMQDLIIKRLHSYILANLGKIKEEFQNPFYENMTNSSL